VVYASWNGATEVTRWRVRDAATNTVRAVAARTGFETAIRMPAATGSVVVEALDGRGRVLGRSRTVRAG
jgi:hypothetical protein